MLCNIALLTLKCMSSVFQLLQKQTLCGWIWLDFIILQFSSAVVTGRLDHAAGAPAVLYYRPRPLQGRLSRPRSRGAQQAAEQSVGADIDRQSQWVPPPLPLLACACLIPLCVLAWLHSIMKGSVLHWWITIIIIAQKFNVPAVQKYRDIYNPPE